MTTQAEPSAPSGRLVPSSGAGLPEKGPPLIGLAHGSRHSEVAGSVEAVVAAAAAQLDVPGYAAYLDLTEPDLTAVVSQVAADGHRSAVVVPLLFTSAFHAEVDVPDAARAAAKASGMELVMADILGTGDDMLDVVAASAKAAGIHDDQPVLLFSVGSSNAAANASVADLAARLGRQRSGPVVCGFGTANPRGRDLLADLPAPAGVLPLFVSPGLLLDPLLRQAAERGDLTAPPLGARVAPIVAARYNARTRVSADAPIGCQAAVSHSR